MFLKALRVLRTEDVALGSLFFDCTPMCLSFTLLLSLVIYFASQMLFTEHTGGPDELPKKAQAVLEAAVAISMSHPNIVSCLILFCSCQKELAFLSCIK